MKNYIPKSKFDLDAIEELKTLSFETVKANVPKLLEWMQDMNWPVGYGIATYFAPHVNSIKKELLDILNTDDELWKYWIIGSLISRSHDNPDQELIFIIKRIAEHPTKNEKEDCVDEVAIAVIADKNW